VGISLVVLLLELVTSDIFGLIQHVTPITLILYVLMLSQYTHLIMAPVKMVSPSVVLLDNHTTSRTGKVNPMAGSGKINLMKTGKVILLTI